MMLAVRAVRCRPEHRAWRLIRAAGSTTKEDLPMKWETPEAIDFRFGMEITMYISNR
jgi:coenzyme PQQ precursor peptide PqqA